MSESVVMPALGESVTEGTVTRWLKQVGDTVAVDEPLVEISTDKVDTEVPSPVAGVVESIVVAEDETAEIGAVLVVIGDGSGSGAAPAAPSAPAASEVPAEAPTAEASPAETVQAPATAPSPSIQADNDGTPVVMPALGESVTEGTVTRWLKQVGDAVSADEPLLEVSTDKVDTEIPAPASGTLLSIAVGEDETAQVGATLAVLGSSAANAEPANPTPSPTQTPAPPPATQAASTPQVNPTPPATPASVKAPGSAAHVMRSSATTYVTPLVRRLATDNNIDLSTLTGTGVGGRIRKQDVQDAIKAKAAAPAGTASMPKPTPITVDPAIAALRGTTVPLSRLRKVIATRMVESLQVSAQLTTVIEVDVTSIARLREQAKHVVQQQYQAKLSFLPFFARAAVEALQQFPMVNASIVEDSVVYHGEVNLGVAVDTERGLLVPVLHHADAMSVAQLAAGIADVADKTRNNKITPDQLSGGTFTLTNTGSRGALFDTPIINQPQVAILGTGTVVRRPVVKVGADGDETIAVRSMVYLSLSYDHRLVDGADAARFLSAMKLRLEEGAFETVLGV